MSSHKPLPQVPSDKEPYRLRQLVLMAAGVVVFLLLNIYVLVNISSWIPDERTRQLIALRFNPAFWADWWSSALWTLAIGVTLSIFLQRVFRQGRGTARKPFLDSIPVVRRCTSYLERYPLERRVLAVLTSVRHVLTLPRFINAVSLLAALSITVSHTCGYAVLTHYLFITLPLFPFWLCYAVFILPLWNFFTDGTVSLLLFFTALMVFFAVLGGRSVLIRLQKAARRQENIPLIRHYAKTAAFLLGLIYFYPVILGLIWTRYAVQYGYDNLYLLQLTNYLFFGGPCVGQILTLLILLAVLLIVEVGFLYRRWKRVQNLSVVVTLILIAGDTVFLVLNGCFFLWFSHADAFVRWYDLRFYPFWTLILPAALVLFALSGLLLTRKTPKIMILLFTAIFCLPGSSLEAQDSLLKIIEPAKYSQANRNIRNTPSQRAPKGNDDAAQTPIVDCFAAMEYRFTGGRFENSPVAFRLHIPENIRPHQKYPLIVLFHGKGDRGNNNTGQLAHLHDAAEFFIGIHQQDFFLLALQCPPEYDQWSSVVSSRGQGDSPLTMTGDILEAVIREYPVDENRLSVLGISSGGLGAWEFVARHPRQFAALSAIAARPPEQAEEEKFLITAIWCFNNRNDTDVDFSITERFAESINARGGNTYQSVYEAAGHDAWTRALRDDKIVGWLLQQSLAKPGPPQGFICRPLTAYQQFLYFGLPALIIAVCLTVSLLSKRKEIKL